MAAIALELIQAELNQLKPPLTFPQEADSTSSLTRLAVLLSNHRMIAMRFHTLNEQRQKAKMSGTFSIAPRLHCTEFHLSSFLSTDGSSFNTCVASCLALHFYKFPRRLLQRITTVNAAYKAINPFSQRAYVLKDRPCYRTIALCDQ